MAGSKVSSIGVLAMVFLAYAVIARAAHSPAQAPAPTNDGTSIDQGIAYVLMLLALVLTYIIH